MSAPSPFAKFTTAFVAVAIVGSSAAAAPSSAPRLVDPLVVVSVFGTAQSVAAVCAASSATASAGASSAAAAQTPGDGCVLPVVDAPPPAVAETASQPLAPVAPPTGGIAALPLLAGLAAVVGLAAIFMIHDNPNGKINLPISP